MVPDMSNRRGRGVFEVTEPDTTGEYLNSLPPSWITLQTALGLSVLLALIFCAKRISSWFSSSTTSYLNHPTHCPEELGHQPAYPFAWSMDEKQTRPKSALNAPKGQHVSFAEEKPTMKKMLSIEPAWKGNQDSLPRPLMARPPPAPPLTPPELSNAVFTFEDRPRNVDSFIHQPNPDYSSSSTTTSASQSHSASPPTPRRRSYNKTLPIGIPVPVAKAESDPDSADLTFSPSSYPPTSPLLPPAPPGVLGSEEDESKTAREIDVRGEIISVLDGEGAGWTRHTRVYGGGVCLACAASGGNHGGGFYGATVRPEEMR